MIEVEVKADVTELPGPLDLWTCKCPECNTLLSKELPDDLAGAHFECPCKVDCYSDGVYKTDSCEEFDTRCCQECKDTLSVKVIARK